MLTPETILQGRYRIVRKLGQGGMGAVYEAVDQRLDTTVALKETLFTDERLRKQFEREARLLARLHHPALPRVSDHFSEGDGQFLVMQFIQGDDLAEKMTLKRGPFPVDQVLTWADQLLDALDYLHTQDPRIVHRDIKPQNLKITARGQIILLDFGLAKGQAGDISRVTTTASIFGYTPNYAPLEQIQGFGTDPRSDLYSLGATLYHLMTGVKPPDALTRAAALVNGQPDPLASTNEANPAIAPAIDDVLRKAMAQGREQRYATALDMRRDLHLTQQTATVANRTEAQTVLFPQAAPTMALPAQTVARQETVRTGETTVVRPVSSGPRKRVLPWALSAAVLLLLACGVLGFYAFQKRNVTEAQLPLAAPTPVETTASSSPSLGSEVSDNTEPAKEKRALEKKDSAGGPPPVPNKTETPSRRDEARRSARPNSDSTRVDTEGRGHGEASDDPEIPSPPDVQGPVRRPRTPSTKVMPGGVVVRSFPDGSSIITMGDGSRIYVGPDGRRQVLGPRQRVNKRLPSPLPSP